MRQVEHIRAEARKEDEDDARFQNKTEWDEDKDKNLRKGDSWH